MQRLWNRAKFGERAGAGRGSGAVSILLWVCLTVILFHGVMWFLSIGVLLSQVGAVESEFAEGAMRDHGGYVVLTNLKLLLGYGIVSGLFVFLLYPLVTLWLRGREPHSLGHHLEDESAADLCFLAASSSA